MSLIKQFSIYTLIVISMPIAFVGILAASIYNILGFLMTEYPRIIFNFAMNKTQ